MKTFSQICQSKLIFWCKNKVLLKFEKITQWQNCMLEVKSLRLL